MNTVCITKLEPNTELSNVKVPSDWHRKLKDAAKSKGMSMGAFVATYGDRIFTAE
jgi:hypothetical protein